MSKHNVTIANHTAKHNHIVCLPGDEKLNQWREHITKDIADAQAKIEKEIGKMPKNICLPFWRVQCRNTAAFEKMDYIAFTRQAGVLSSDTDLQTLPKFPFGGSYTELSDFIEKINTRALPVKTVAFYADKKQKLPDLMVREGDKPYLALSLADKNLLKKIRHG